MTYASYASRGVCAGGWADGQRAIRKDAPEGVQGCRARGVNSAPSTAGARTSMYTLYAWNRSASHDCIA